MSVDSLRAKLAAGGVASGLVVMEDLKRIIKHVRSVDRMFEESKKYAGQSCEWPIIGGGYVVGYDRTDKMMELAVRAILARDQFVEHGPPDAPPLPLSYDEMADMKDIPGGPLRHLVSCYASSLSANNWIITRILASRTIRVAS